MFSLHIFIAQAGQRPPGRTKIYGSHEWVLSTLIVKCIYIHLFEVEESVTHSLSPHSFSELNSRCTPCFTPAADGQVVLLVMMSKVQTT